MHINYSGQPSAVQGNPEKNSALHPGQVDRIPKKTRRKSMLRDAAFLRALQALRSEKARAETEGTSVIEESPTLPTSPTSPMSSPSVSVLSSSKARQTPTWWESLYGEPWGFSDPAEWRDLSDPGRAHYYGQASADVGPSLAFSLNLSPEIEAMARSMPSPLGWLAARLAYHLKALLGVPSEFMAAIEETDDVQHRLHVHGILCASPDEAETVRKALRKAGGEWPGVRQHQAHTSPSPDDGWASYCVKNVAKASPMRRSLPAYSWFRASFTGDPLFATAGLKRRAKALYTADRSDMIEALKHERQSTLTDKTPCSINTDLSFISNGLGDFPLAPIERTCESESAPLDRGEHGETTNGLLPAGRDLQRSCREASEHSGLPCDGRARRECHPDHVGRSRGHLAREHPD